RRSEYYLCPAEFLKFRGGIGPRAIDVNVRTQFLRQRLAILAAADGRHAIAKLRGELNSEMAEPANSQYGHKVPWSCSAVTQSIERRDPSAQEGSGLHGIKQVRHRRHSFRWSHRVLRIAAVKMD